MGKGTARGEATSRATGQPLSVTLTRPQREAFAREGVRRGIALSTAVRTLALERLRELTSEEELERARRWQGEEARKIFDAAQDGTMALVAEEEIDAIFADLDERPRERTKRRS